MIDILLYIKNSVIFVIFVRCSFGFARMYGDILIFVPVSNPTRVTCFAVDGQRLQKNSFWCPQIVRSVDIEDALILFFVACQFMAFFYSFLLNFTGSVFTCSLVAIQVSVGF